MSDSCGVLIVEDQVYTRRKLADAVSQHGEMNLVATADSVATGLEAIQTHKPDILLTDLNLPDGNGVDLIRWACEIGGIESIVITVFGDEGHVVDAIRAGATGYLLKDCDAVEIGDAITQVRDGGSPISPSIARYLLRHFTESPRNDGDGGNAGTALTADVPDLTRREQDVLQLIAKGFSYQEIANTLALSIHTVKSHIKHIYRKLAVKSRGEAVYEAGQYGLL